MSDRISVRIELGGMIETMEQYRELRCEGALYERYFSDGPNPPDEWYDHESRGDPLSDNLVQFAEKHSLDWRFSHGDDYDCPACTTVKRASDSEPREIYDATVGHVRIEAIREMLEENRPNDALAHMADIEAWQNTNIRPLTLAPELREELNAQKAHDEIAAQMKPFTAWCREASGEGTIWIGSVEATDAQAAARQAIIECANDWAGFPPSKIVCIGIAEGDVTIANWDDEFGLAVGEGE